MTAANTPHVGSVMTDEVETIPETASIREAASRMRSHGINSLLVPGSETGIVTSTDVLDAIAAGDAPDETTVADVMTVPVEWVESDLQLQEAASMMDTYGINHLPVRDKHGDYAGMVSSTDLRQVLEDVTIGD